MRTITSIFIALAMLSVASSNIDYCHITNCGARHTACRYPNSGQACTGNLGNGLTDAEKQRILKQHNELRHKVASGNETQGSNGSQPAAKSMPDLEWDDEIASIAQRWAEQCTYAHDSCRDVERFPVGQNIAIIGTSENISTIKVETMVQMWYDEVKYVSQDQVANFTNAGQGGEEIAHYTQMVWANTTKLGCGASKWHEGVYNKFYLVCNYGPSGNWLTLPIYPVA